MGPVALLSLLDASATVARGASFDARAERLPQFHSRIAPSWRRIVSWMGMAAQNLDDVLSFVAETLRRNEKSAYRVSDYKAGLYYHEAHLRGMQGLELNSSDRAAPSWLKIARLVKEPPPGFPHSTGTDIAGKNEIIANDRWVSFSDDPNSTPALKDVIRVLLPLAEARKLVLDNRITHSDYGEQNATGRVTVTLPIAQFPETKSLYDSWLQNSWLPWTERERPRRKAIAFYDELFKTHAAITGRDAALEVIIGVGIVRGKIAGHDVDHPIVEYRAEIRVDPKTAAITVIGKDDSCDIFDFPAEDGAGAAALMSAARSHWNGLPDACEISPFEKLHWEPVLQAAASFLGSAGEYTPLAGSREVPGVANGFKVFDSWIFLVRPSSLRPLLIDIAQLQEELRNAETVDPLISLLDDPLNAEHLIQQMIDRVADLVRSATASVQVTTGSGGFKQVPVSVAPYFPKLSNQDQEKIIRILQKGASKGLVVQGPPGTGKSHSIANILCHALASGWRVLVAAHGDGPLQVLKGMLPAELRNLAINLSTSEQSDVSQLEESVKAIAAIATKVDDPAAHVRKIEQTEERIIANKIRLVEINECFLSWARDNLDYTETYSGRQTAAALAETIVAAQGANCWFDDIIELKNLVPPLGEPEIGRLRAIRAQLGSDLSSFDWKLPEAAAIPIEDEFVRIHAALKETARLQGDVPTIKIEHLAGISDGKTRALNLQAMLGEILASAELIKKRPWLATWLEDAKLPVTEQLLVPSLDELLQLMQASVAAEVNFVRAQVVVPKRPALLKEAISKAINSEKPYSKLPLLRPSPEVMDAIDLIRVRGKQPVKQEWEEALRYLQWVENNSVIASRWNALADLFFTEKCPSDNAAAVVFFKTLIRDLRLAEALLADLAAVSESTKPLSQSPLDGDYLEFGLDNIDETTSLLKQWIEAIGWRIAQLDIAWASARLEQVRKCFAGCSGSGCVAAQALVEVLGTPTIQEGEIAKSWREILVRIENDRAKRTLGKELEEGADKLALAGAKRWAHRIKTITVASDRTGIANTDSVLPATWQDAWVWSAWKGKLEAGKSLRKIKELLAEKSAIDEELFRLMGRVVVLRTELQLSRLPKPLITKLTLFQDAVQRTGAGTGVRAARLRKEAKKLAAQCYEAVPCWIMPIKKVAETQPSKLGIFDLVIIDEASQCGPEAIPVIMRGKKALIVGDDKQVSPTSFMAEEAYAHLHARFLAESPYRSALSPGASMYNLASAMFAGDNVRLREHFRCVEPIIRFSMRFYGDDANSSLIPLRIPKPSERLDPPIIDVFVPHGVAHGKTNSAEANVIAAEIERIVSNSAYDGKSIGVISLNGADQAAVIEKAIINRLGPEVFGTRNLLVADSSGFQGKERSIMFLSMVDAPNRRSMARVQDIYAQRYNVALSRARDRMYLVRSLGQEKLQNPKDLRRLAMQHFADPMPTESVRRAATDDLIAKCDSGFERDVLSRLLRDGYDAIPQFPAAGYKIDIIVEGEDDRRLAIELDGDVYHPPEQYAKDMERQQQLERIGFKFWRCWWSEWILSPDICYSDLIAKLESLGVKPLVGQRKARSAYSASFIASEDGELFSPEEFTARDSRAEADEPGRNEYLDAEFSEVAPEAGAYAQLGGPALDSNILLLPRANVAVAPLNAGDILVVQTSNSSGDGECRTRHLQICPGSEVILALGKVGAMSGLGLMLAQSAADDSFDFTIDGQELAFTIIAVRRAA